MNFLIIDTNNKGIIKNYCPDNYENDFFLVILNYNSLRKFLFELFEEKEIKSY